MIVFKTALFEIDLSGYGLSLTEQCALFTDNIYRSYSLPFTIEADEELLVKLGLPHLQNINNVSSSINGTLQLPDVYYNATLYLGEINGKNIECEITFGDQDLPVYDIELKNLPWPIILSPDLLNFANDVRQKSWPDVGYNFVMMYNPKIKEESNYELFDGFVNNYVSGYGYLENRNYQANGEEVYQNRNVMAPFPYLIEILRFGFLQEGKVLRGKLLDDELFKKAVYVPETYLEKFRGSEFQQFNFSTPDEIIQEDNVSYGIYKKRFLIETSGDYEIDFTLNLDPVIATNFTLQIVKTDPEGNVVQTIYGAQSRRNRVSIEEKLEFNQGDTDLYGYIEITLKLIYTSQNIAGYNSFEYAYKNGRLNEFPTYFSLNNFMPDMTFGEYVNELKNWLNLDIDIRDGEVIINYTQDSIFEKARTSHTHLEVPQPTIQHNNNRLYKLNYANEEQIIYNKNGQVYSDLDEEGADVVTVDIDVQPVKVERNEDKLTAVLPEERAGLDFCVYDSDSSKAFADPELTKALSLQAVFDARWVKWLGFRINSKSFKENFTCSIYEHINIKELSFKYNELHVIKKLTRKFISEKTMKVEIESETF